MVKYVLSIMVFINLVFASEYVDSLLELANHENPEAQYNLGQYYEKGNNSKQSYKKALKWYQRSAENNNSRAQFQLYFYYLRGIKVKRNKQMAIQWLSKAVEQELPEAQHYMAMEYFAKHEKKKAFELELLASKAGYRPSLTSLAEKYLHGWGVKPDTSEAIKWLKNASELGSCVANVKLGEIYYQQGDINACKKEYEIAIAKGCDRTVQRLEIIEARQEIAKNGFSYSLAKKLLKKRGSLWTKYLIEVFDQYGNESIAKLYANHTNKHLRFKGITFLEKNKIPFD